MRATAEKTVSTRQPSAASATIGHEPARDHQDPGPGGVGCRAAGMAVRAIGR
jgi:hypothetical protein